MAETLGQAATRLQLELSRLGKTMKHSLSCPCWECSRKRIAFFEAWLADFVKENEA